jgi:Ig-like domain from next to BRCA1 gene
MIRKPYFLLIFLTLLMNACNLPVTPGPGETSPETQAVDDSQSTISSLIAPAQALLKPQDSYIPIPPITPIPSKTEAIHGTTYLVYHIEPDGFRFICPQNGCGLDERLIFASYAGFKVRKEKLVRIAGVDILDEFKPLDIHLVKDGECTRSAGEWGSAGPYDAVPNSALICLYLDEVDKFTDAGAFGYIDPDPRNPMTAQTAIRAGGSGVIGHEYSHVIFFNRQRVSSEEYVNTLDYAATLGDANSGYLDLCDPLNEYSAGILYKMCHQYGLTLADFRTSLIELDRLHRDGYGELFGATSVNQHREVLQEILGVDPFDVFKEAGYYDSYEKTTPYQSPYSNETCTYRAELLEDVSVPAGTMFDVNTPFEKTWRIQNTGTCAWGDGYELVFAGEEAMTGTLSVPIPATASNATVDLTLALTAPASPGVHVGQWRLRRPDGNFFGPIINLTIFTRTGCSLPPEISSFTSTPSAVGQGAMILLEWDQVTNADRVEILPEIGEVTPNGGRLLIQPPQTTTFTLRATCGAQTAEQKTVVTIDSNIPPFEIADVTAQAVPDNFSGVCLSPDNIATRIDFGVNITANGPGVILYKWDRSDAAISQTITAVVDPSKPETITGYWMLSRSYTGYMEAHILGPKEYPPARASFTLTCTQ